MTIIFYKTDAELNRIGKTLTEGLTMNGTLRSECSILNPVVDIEMPPNNTTLVGYNYAYIADFGKRYYFITEIVSKTERMWEISMHVDVLESFKDQVLPLNALVARNEKKYDIMIKDPIASFREQPRMREYFSDTKLFVDDTVATIIVNSVTFNTPYESGVTPTSVDGLAKIPSAAQCSNNYCMTSYILVGDAVVREFLEWLMGTGGEQAASFIISIFACPFQIEQWRNNLVPAADLLLNSQMTGYNQISTTQRTESGTTVKWEFKYGKERAQFDTEETLDVCYVYAGNNQGGMSSGASYIQFWDEIFNIGDFIFQMVNKRGYMAFSPYSEYELIMPFAGNIQIDPRKVYDLIKSTQEQDIRATVKTYVRWIIDVSTGMGTWQLALYSADTMSRSAEYVRIIDGGDVQVLQPIPISYTTADNVERNRTAHQLTAIGNGMTGFFHALSSSIMGLGSGAAAKNAEAGGTMMITSAISGAIDAVGSVTGAVVGYYASEATNVVYGSGGVRQSYTNQLFTNMRYCFREFVVESPSYIMHDQWSGVDPVGGPFEPLLAPIAGAPLHKTVSLSTMHGITVIQEIHLDGVVCTSTEKDELYRKLTTGVILPD